ncbi:MAG: restriction endonuclease [Chloroflexi bacterium]|nr:restriction endonuclease [Chloroflexota bacterium]
MTETFAITLDILFSVFGFVFDFWFFLILAPLKYKGNLLGKMLGMWVFLTILRGFILLDSTPATPLFIYEPLNTMLFAASGVVIFGTYTLRNRQAWNAFKRKTSAVKDLETLLQLSASEFEQMVVDVYEAAGHRAKRTGTTGDHGVDVVVQSKNGEKWVVQCKRWRGKVGEPIVRDFYGTIQHEKADKGTIITTGKFTAQAREWAKGKPITLYDGERFLRAWEQAKIAAKDGQDHKVIAHPSSGR